MGDTPRNGKARGVSLCPHCGREIEVTVTAPREAMTRRHPSNAMAHPPETRAEPSH